MSASAEPRAGIRRLMGQFPAMRSIGERISTRHISVIHQMTASDCGAACLAMVLGFLGRPTDLASIRSSLVVGRDGVGARAILEAGARHGLRGRAVRIALADLEHLPRGSILHWSFSHFVVFSGIEKKGVRLNDPAFGRRLVSMDEMGKQFTGVALLFERSNDFVPTKANQNIIVKHLRTAIRSFDDWRRIVATSILLQVLSLVLPIINGRFIDRVIPRSDTHLFVVLVVGLVLTVVFYFAASVVRGHLLFQLQTRFDAKMTFGLLDHMLQLPYAFFEQRHPGDLQMRVASMSIIREVLIGAVLSAAIDGVMVASQVTFVAFVSLRMMAIALSIVFVNGVAYILFQGRLTELAGSSVAKQADAASALNELLSGMESLKASGCEERASQSWANKYVDILNIGLRQGSLSALNQGVMGTLSLAGPMILLAGGILEVVNGRLTLGTMMAANALAAGFIQPVIRLIGTLQNLQMAKVHLERIEDIFGTPAEQAPSRRLSVAPRLTGRIEVARVSFRYAPDLPLAVKDVSIAIRPGEFIAIVGRSGSGKTTLGRLLLGLYAPGEGVVRYDGIPLTSMDRRSLRQQVGVVTQKAQLFGSSIGANIALVDPSLPLERIVEAAERACIHDDIMKMPLLYHTPVVAGGGSLSGGQRQRVTLARALANRPSVLLLDEATSALDAATEAKVQAELARLSCTRIFIAHRLSTIIGADRILMMEDGMIVEEGSHFELLKLGGAYAKLIQAQLAAETGHGQAQVRRLVPIGTIDDDDITQVNAAGIDFNGGEDTAEDTRPTQVVKR